MGQHLQAIYDTRVAEGMLRPDPVQRAALLRLEELREKLEAPERKGFCRGSAGPNPRASRGFISGAASGGASPC
jgi:predicted ATPase